MTKGQFLPASPLLSFLRAANISGRPSLSARSEELVCSARSWLPAARSLWEAVRFSSEAGRFAAVARSAPVEGQAVTRAVRTSEFGPAFPLAAIRGAAVARRGTDELNHSA